MRPGNAGSTRSSVTAGTQKIARRSRASGAADALFSLARTPQPAHRVHWRAGASNHAHGRGANALLRVTRAAPSPTQLTPRTHRSSVASSPATPAVLSGPAPTVAARHSAGTTLPRAVLKRVRAPLGARHVCRNVRRPPARTCWRDVRAHPSRIAASLEKRTRGWVSRPGTASNTRRLPGTPPATTAHTLMPQLAGARREASYRPVRSLRACAPAVFPKVVLARAPGRPSPQHPSRRARAARDRGRHSMVPRARTRSISCDTRTESHGSGH